MRIFYFRRLMKVIGGYSLSSSRMLVWYSLLDVSTLKKRYWWGATSLLKYTIPRILESIWNYSLFEGYMPLRMPILTDSPRKVVTGSFSCGLTVFSVISPLRTSTLEVERLIKVQIGEINSSTKPKSSCTLLMTATAVFSYRSMLMIG